MKVRWGLLSTARINRFLIPAIRASSRGQLVAVASRSHNTARAYAAKWHIPHAFGRYEAMLASGLIDAVYISLPNHLHAEWTINALRAGVHVLCEKPLAVSVAEVDQMVAASRESGQLLAEAFMYRHHPQTKIVGEWAKSGRLGEISMVRAAFNFSLRSRDNIRLVPEFGGGCLWDVGVYPISLAQFIYGRQPDWVSGIQWLGDSKVDETFAGQMHYPGDHIAQITASFRTPFHTHAEITGTRGCLILTRPFTAMDEKRHATFFPADGQPREIPVPEMELYSGEVEDMHAAILDGSPQNISLDESRNHVRTVEALYESARARQVVRLD